MAVRDFLFVITLSVLSRRTLALWSCSTNSECDVTGSVCLNARCVCPPGQEVALGGTVCADIAPYHTSPCVEDSQCSRLFSNYECRREDEETVGQCLCQSGHHYFLGRCWGSVEFGEACTRDEQCMGELRDPYSLVCRETCVCADGYYVRQGECRKIAYAVGDGCVLDEDCQFPNGVCNQATFSCVTSSNVAAPSSTVDAYRNTTTNVEERSQRQHFRSCDATNPCTEPFLCSGLQGSCICPTGYYSDASGSRCLAELGSPSTEAQCDGLLAVVRDGVCVCPPNFYFEEDMRNCVRATRSITESCVSDLNCHTFGAASRCGDPQEPWGLRSCECLSEISVWDSNRQMCRLFASIGETCEVNSDCMAGELEIQCVVGDDGVGHCACPGDLVEVDGLCLTSGLDLGDSCQANQECTATANTACVNGRCSCDNGYQETEDYCAPIIGGMCSQNSDCVIEHTICSNDTSTPTCQCDFDFVTYNEECWPISTYYEAQCNVTAQCVNVLGEDSMCEDYRCVCSSGYHYRDGSCWAMTRLFESCSRTSECFLEDISDRVLCINSICQCSFDYEYSEQLRTCVSTSSVSTIVAGLTSIIITLTFPSGPRQTRQESTLA
ncbi:LOW QUALITY PROTEIN: uncharacterized protein ACR2FA_011030 [Aphomia sociella]